MTKKDFIIIAKAIKEAKKIIITGNLEPGEEQAAIAGIEAATIELVKKLADTNPRFNAQKFVKACCEI